MQHDSCRVAGCDRAGVVRGWCRMHYSRWYRGSGDLHEPLPKWTSQPATCQIDGCDKPTKSRGMCGMHYRRWWKEGKPGGALPRVLGDIECCVAGCEHRQESNGMCRSHSHRDVQLRANYGIDLARYFEMHASQDGRCAVCGSRSYDKQGRSLAVDHCHSTGQVRGLLCGNCNMTLGKVGDDPAWLRRLADYLEAGGA